MIAGPDLTRVANRVGACAVGLAFAGRSDAEALRELIDMADGSASALARARARLAELVTVDEAVMQRAARLLQTTAAQVAEGADTREDDPGTLLTGS